MKDNTVEFCHITNLENPQEDLPKFAVELKDLFLKYGIEIIDGGEIGFINQASKINGAFHVVGARIIGNKE